MALRLAAVLTADTRQFRQGVDQAARSLDRLEREEQQVARAADRMDREHREAAQTFRNLGVGATAALRGIATGVGIAVAGVGTLGIAFGALGSPIARAGDELKLLRAQLDALGAGAESVNALFEAADRLGVGVETVAETFRRFSIARDELGLTTAEILRLTETVIALGRLSGASATELSASALQLAQALASGRLQGDELRSVLENAPLLAKELASELGVSVGQLRQMGAEGELTGRRIAEALLRVAERVDDQFERLPDTLDAAAARVANSWSRLLATLDARLHVSDAFVFFTETIADALDALRIALGGATPLEQLEMDIAAAKVRADELQRSLEGIVERLADPATLTGHMRRTLEEAKASGEAELTALERSIAEMEKRLAALRGGKATGEEERPSELPASAPGEDALQRARRIAELEAEAAAQGRLAQAYADSEQAARALQIQLAAEAEARKLGIELASAEGQRILEAVRARAAAEESIRRIVEQRQAEARLVDMVEAREAELFRLQMQAAGAWDEQMQRRLDLRRLELELQRQGIDLTDEEIARQLDILRALDDQIARQNQLAEAQRKNEQLGRDVASAITGGFRQMAFEARSFEDALAGVAQRLADIAFQKAVEERFADFLGNLFSGGFGNLFGSASYTGIYPEIGAVGPGGLLGRAARGAVVDAGEIIPFARGGIVDRPVLFPLARGAGLMGEAGPEAILPLTRLPDGRLGVAAAGGADRPVRLEIRVVDKRSGSGAGVEVREVMPGPGADRAIEIMVERGVQRLAETGRLDTFLGPRYGARPIPR